MTGIPLSYAAQLLNSVRARPEQASYLIDLSTAVCLLHIATELTLLRRQLAPLGEMLSEITQPDPQKGTA